MIRIPAEPHQSARSAFTLVELIVVLAIVAILIGLTLPAIQQSRGAARNAECKNRLRQVVTGLQNHHSQFGILPQDGKNGWGYATYLLPQVEQAPLFERLSPARTPLASGAPVSAGLTDSVVAVYLCPEFASAPTIPSGHGRLAFLGNPQVIAKKRMQLSDILDGESTTAAFGETNGDRAWAFPGTAPESTPNSGGDYGSRHAGGANFAMCDGSVRWISNSVDSSVMKALFSVAGKDLVPAF